MSGETRITLVGNLVDDPELRYTPSGQPVANFRVASTPRVFDRTSGDWRDGETLFMRCTAWRSLAENLAGSLHKGARVSVTGVLEQRSYETDVGERRYSFEVTADDVAASLLYATAAITKAAPATGKRAAVAAVPA